MKVKVGMSRARILPKIDFWDSFFEKLGVDYMFSDIHPKDAIALSEKTLIDSDDFCLWRKIDFGQYVDLVNQGCTHLFVPSTRSHYALACNSSRFIPDQLSAIFKNVKVVNMVNFADEPSLRIKALKDVASLLTDDMQKVQDAINLWPHTFIEKNVFLHDNEDADITLILFGKIFHFFDYRDESSPLIKYMINKLNVRVLSVWDTYVGDVKTNKNMIKYIKSISPYWSSQAIHYWDRRFIFSSLINPAIPYDGVLYIKDPLCDVAKEESSSICRFLEENQIKYYMLNYSFDALSSTETAISAFVEMLRVKKIMSKESVNK